MMPHSYSPLPNYSPMSNQQFNLFAQESLRNKSCFQPSPMARSTQNTPTQKVNRSANRSPHHTYQDYDNERQQLYDSFSRQLNDLVARLVVQEGTVKKSCGELKAQFSHQLDIMNSFVQRQKQLLDQFQEEQLDTIKDYFTQLDQQYQKEQVSIQSQLARLQHYQMTLRSNNMVTLPQDKFVNVLAKYQVFLDSCKDSMAVCQQRTYTLVQIKKEENINEFSRQFKQSIEQFFIDQLVNHPFIEQTMPNNSLYQSNRNVSQLSQQFNNSVLLQKFLPKTTKSIEVPDDHEYRSSSNNASIIINANVEQKENFYSTNPVAYRSTVVEPERTDDSVMRDLSNTPEPGLILENGELDNQVYQQEQLYQQSPHFNNKF